MFIHVQEPIAKLSSRPSGSRANPTWVYLAWRAAGVVLFSLLLMASSVSSQTSRSVDVKAKRYAFEPAEITVKRGESVQLRLTSADVAHGLRIRELKIDVHASKGKTAVTTFTPQNPGTFVGHCSVFCGSGHGEMTFTIHVVA